jgi:hypothetical protein
VRVAENYYGYGKYNSYYSEKALGDS